MSSRPARQSMAKTMMTAMMEKAMRLLRTTMGETESAKSEKAAPVLRTWVRRKTPGMTVMA